MRRQFLCLYNRQIQFNGFSLAAALFKIAEIIIPKKLLPYNGFSNSATLYVVLFRYFDVVWIAVFRIYRQWSRISWPLSRGQCWRRAKVSLGSADSRNTYFTIYISRIGALSITPNACFSRNHTCIHLISGIRKSLARIPQ